MVILVKLAQVQLGLFLLLLSVFVCVFQFLSEVGFSNVRAEDRTEQFIQVIKVELQRAEEMKEEFIQVNTHSCLYNVCITLTTTHLHAVGGNIFPFSLPFILATFAGIDDMFHFHLRGSSSININ